MASRNIFLSTQNKKEDGLRKGWQGALPPSGAHVDEGQRNREIINFWRKDYEEQVFVRAVDGSGCAN